MMRGYYSFYLRDVQMEMGVLFHVAFSKRHEFTDYEEFVAAFLKSKAVWGIELRHPHWLAGSSGIEWYMEILDDIGVKYTQEEMGELRYYPDDAYWCGHVIAFYQWLNAIPFKDILKPGILGELFSRYCPLHEADITVAVDVLDKLLDRVSEGKDDPFGEEYVPEWDDEEENDGSEMSQNDETIGD